MTSGYHHCEMDTSSHTYLGFNWAGVDYVFTVLPFGLASAPRIFTKVTRELCAKWRAQGIRLLHYLDDFLFVAPTRELLLQHQAVILADLAAAGFLLNTAKSQLTPTRTLTHLGFDLDLSEGTFTLPAPRAARLQSDAQRLLTAGGGSARALASVAGQIMATSTATGKLAYTHSRGLYRLIDQRTYWSTYLPLTTEATQDLQFWTSTPLRSLTAPIFLQPSRPSCTIHSDAGDNRWGAELSSSAGPIPASGSFLGIQRYSNLAPPPKDGKISSTLRELFGLHQAIHTFAPRLRHTEVHLFTDNKGVESIIRRGGSMGRDLHALAIDLFSFCLQHRIRITCTWIPRERNTAADALSKDLDYNSWSLTPSTYQRICRRLGHPTRDLFASPLNAKCPEWYSRHWTPTSSTHHTAPTAVDAFSLPTWRLPGRSYICAPFPPLGRVMRKLEADQAAAIVIIPIWPRAIWWHHVAPDGAHWHPHITHDFTLPPNSFSADADAPPGMSLPPTSRIVAAWVDFTPAAAPSPRPRCIWSHTCRLCHPL